VQVTEVTEVAKATRKLNAIGIAGTKTFDQEAYIPLRDVKLITAGCCRSLLLLLLLLPSLVACPNSFNPPTVQLHAECARTRLGGA